MRGFWALLEKDIRLSLPWFLTNLTVVLLFVGLAAFNIRRGNEVGVLFFLLAGAGMFLWSIFAGIATYFSEREGRIYEFVNSLPVSRILILLSKEVWLVLQATIYFTVLVLGAYLIFRTSEAGITSQMEQIGSIYDIFKAALSGYLRILLTLTAGLVSASLVKDLPFRWFFAIVMLLVIVWAVGWIDLSSVLGTQPVAQGQSYHIASALNSQILNEGVRFAATLVFLLLGGAWIERRGY